MQFGQTTELYICRHLVQRIRIASVPRKSSRLVAWFGLAIPLAKRQRACIIPRYM